MGPEAARRLLRAVDDGRTRVGAHEDAAEREADRQARGLPARPATRMPRRAEGGVLAETHGTGRQLDDSTRRAMEARLGADFSGIRVHHDEAAAASADALGTLAFTDGAHIVFGRGQYQPGRLSGQSLLAHELSHVAEGHAASGVLRRGGPAPAPGGKARSGGLTSAEWVKIRNARKYFNLPPAPTEGETTIVGVLIDPSGNEYPLMSGHEGGPYGGTQRGNVPRGKGQGFSSGAPTEKNIGTHIEGHAAAKMYELGLTEATLLSPEPPCKVCDISQGWDPESGGWTAAAAKKPGVAAINTVLPPGARLTIVDPEATGIYTSYRLGPPAGPAAPPHPAAPPKTAAAAHPAAPPKTAAAAHPAAPPQAEAPSHPAAPPQAEAAPPSVRPAAGGGTLEPGPASTPARPRLGSRVVSSTAVAALQLGALVLLGEAAERRGQRRFEEALADATPWIEEQVRIQSQSPTAQALRARSPQHKLYARLHVWQEEQFTYQTGPGIGEGWWAPSGFTYSFSPIVTLVDSLPAESPSVPYIDPGFGSYMNVTEFNLWFEINSSR